MLIIVALSFIRLCYICSPSEESLIRPMLAKARTSFRCRACPWLRITFLMLKVATCHSCSHAEVLRIILDKYFEELLFWGPDYRIKNA